MSSAKPLLSNSTPTHLAFFFDRIAGLWLTNPFVICTVLAALGLYSVALSLQMYCSYGSQVFLENNSRYLVDIVNHLVNLIFVLRFPSRSKRGLFVKSNLVFEGALCLLSNVLVIYMITNPESWSVSDQHFFFRVVMWTSLLCPYAILAFGIIDHVFEDSDAVDEKTIEALAWNTKISSGNATTRLLTSTNNSFLAVFIAQSFAYIRVDIPFLESGVLNLAYIVSSNLLKLHLVHMFLLYETVVAVYEIEDLVAYSELYVPVSLHYVRSWRDTVCDYKGVVMASWTVFIILYDSVLFLLASL